MPGHGGGGPGERAPPLARPGVTSVADRGVPPGPSRAGGSRSPYRGIRATTAAWSRGIKSSWWPVRAMPAPPGRSSTLSRPAVLLLEVEVGGGHAVEREAQVAGDGDGLEEDLGHDDGAAQVEPDPAFEAGDQAAEDAEVVQGGPAHRGAVEPGGHVHDVGADGHVDRRRHARPPGGDQQAGVEAGAAVLQDDLAQRGAQARCPSRPPGRRPRRTARRSRARSRTCRPISRGPTSSLVWPAIASSRSWIAADPFIATPVRMPRAIQSFRYGPQPVLITWPPIAASTGRPPACAATIASRSCLSQRPARTSGRPVQQVLQRARAVARPPQVVQPDLARAARQGLVLQGIQVERVVGYGHGRPWVSGRSRLRPEVVGVGRGPQGMWAWNGQISGIRMTATIHMSRLSGMPTRMKSVKR